MNKSTILMDILQKNSPEETLKILKKYKKEGIRYISCLQFGFLPIDSAISKIQILKEDISDSKEMYSAIVYQMRI